MYLSQSHVISILIHDASIYLVVIGYQIFVQTKRFILCLCETDSQRCLSTSIWFVSYFGCGFEKFSLGCLGTAVICDTYLVLPNRTKWSIFSARISFVDFRSRYFVGSILPARILDLDILLANVACKNVVSKGALLYIKVSRQPEI